MSLMYLIVILIPFFSIILSSTVYDIRNPNPLYYQLSAGKFSRDRHFFFFHASLQPHLHFTLRILRVLRREDCARVAACKHPQWETRPGRVLKNSFLPANGVNLVNFTIPWTVDEKERSLKTQWIFLLCCLAWREAERGGREVFPSRVSKVCVGARWCIWLEPSTERGRLNPPFERSR